jgi:hypothetical protein
MDGETARFWGSLLVLGTFFLIGVIGSLIEDAIKARRRRNRK